MKEEWLLFISTIPLIEMTLENADTNIARAYDAALITDYEVCVGINERFSCRRERRNALGIGSVAPLKSQTLFPAFWAELTHQTWARTPRKDVFCCL
jgi:hypothetical protein